MKVKVEIMGDGSVACEADSDCGTRHYRSRYRGLTPKEAKKKFTERVLKSEQEELDRVRLEALLTCLNCPLPAEECKGKCKYKPKNGKMPRGKGATV